MIPLPQHMRLHPGDVLRHTGLGFAVVAGTGPDGLELEWEESGPRPPRLALNDLDEAWSLCVPWGFLARSVRVPGSLRGLMKEAPAAALRLLVDDLGGEGSEEDLLGWIGKRGRLNEDEVQTWWRRCQTVIADLPDIVRFEGRVLVQAASRRAEAWDDGLEAGLSAFLDETPRGRMEILDAAPDSAVEPLLDAAIAARDPAAVLLVLRRAREPSPTSTRDLIRLALDGDPWIAGALLLRGQPELELALAAFAGSVQRRDLVRRALLALPRGRRAEVVWRLLDRALGDDGEGTAARYLVDQVPGGADELTTRFSRGGLATLPPESEIRLLSWLASGAREPPAARAALRPRVERGRPLPADQVLPVVIEIARALTARSAEGDHGGLNEACIAPDGEVVLGPPEQTTESEDVYAAIRLVLTAALGGLPAAARVDGALLLSHLAELVPGLPPAFMAVATRALSSDPERRPAGVQALWLQLAQAQAIETIRQQAPPRASLRWRAGHDTHIGLLKSRLGQTNQDALFWQLGDEVGLLVVADGISVSTAGSGNLASSILISVVASTWERHQPSLVQATESEVLEWATDVLHRANSAVCEAALQLADGDLSRHIPMGSTVVLALLQGDRIHLAWLGDSPAFLVTAQGAARLNADHNLLGEWMESLRRRRPIDLGGEGHALVRYIGHFDEMGRPELPVVGARSLRILPGELLLLCSDGLTDYATDDPAAMAALLEEAAREGDLGRAARSLIERANAGGGGDNITVVLARPA